MPKEKKRTRKAIYISGYLWQLLDEDAVAQRETVTYVLKQILLNHYPAQRIDIARGNNKSPVYDKTTDNDLLSGTEEEEVF